MKRGEEGVWERDVDNLRRLARWVAKVDDPEGPEIEKGLLDLSDRIEKTIVNGEGFEMPEWRTF